MSGILWRPLRTKATFVRYRVLTHGEPNQLKTCTGEINLRRMSKGTKAPTGFGCRESDRPEGATLNDFKRMFINEST